jgi:uncharacterized protein YjbI with pentapeptide repeats
MEVSKLARRWKTPTGTENRKLILESLKKGKNLDVLGFLDTHNGRWDLRGLPFPEPETGETFQFQTYDMTLLKNVPKFKKASFMDIDFSGARFGHSIWERCIFENVIFDEADFSEFSSWGCRFTRSSFRKANLRGSAFLHSRRKPTVFSGVDFSHSDMRNIVLDITVFEECDFSHANLTKVDFHGGRLRDCKFAGVLRATRFRGFDSHDKKSLRNRNPMERVDFSGADLRHVAFTDGIDLSSVIFPGDDNHLVLCNQREVFLKAREIIEKEWVGEDRRIALSMMDDIHLREIKKEQKMDLVNKKDNSEFFGERFANDFSSLLKEVHENIQQTKGRGGKLKTSRARIGG